MRWGFHQSVGLLIPVIKAVIRGDNGGREIAALLWVTYPPVMNPRVARRQLLPPTKSITALTFLWLLFFILSSLTQNICGIVRKDARVLGNFTIYIKDTDVRAEMSAILQSKVTSVDAFWFQISFPFINMFEKAKNSL